MREHLPTANHGSSSWIAAASVLISLTASVGCKAVQKDASTDGESKAVTVCELFRDLGVYSGKMIAVRGIYYFGLRQESCSVELVVGGRRWPLALDLVGSDDVIADSSPVRFITDRTSWDQLDRLVIQEGQTGRRSEVWVTINGLLRGPHRKWLPNSGVVGGYGPLGAFPAQLVVKRVYDVEVKQIPTFNYQEMLPPNVKKKNE